MPNWCENRITIYGEPEDIAKVKDLLQNEESVFSFDKVIPMPKELAEIRTGGRTIAGKSVSQWREVDGENVAVSDEDLARFKKDYGATGWYDWSVANWGCKWDSSNASLEIDEAEELKYLFDSPWGPPEATILALREKFPDLSISAFYDEPGMESAGYY
jgi:hypothetical protein